MKVKFVDYPKQHAKYSEIEEAILRVARSSDRILRGEVQKFEQNLADFVGTKYAIGVANGTDALTMSLRALGVGPGDEVITVGHTFHATVEAIHWNGAKPVLVDVGEDGMMDMKAVAKAITPRTKAIIPVHLMGNVCEMQELSNVIIKYHAKDIGNEIVVLEDACQALGAERTYPFCEGGTYTIKAGGSLGKAGCFSFFPAKILGAYGDAGAVTTDDENLYKELKDMREHYKYSDTPKYGFNSRLDELQAAILNVKFKYLPDMIKRRQEIADLYDAGLKDLPIKLPTKRQGRVYQDYIIRTDRRNELAEFLKENGVETLKNDYHFPIPKPEHTIKLESETLRLPCNDVLEDEEIKYVCEKINEFYTK